jgi:hypothetical protein
MEKKYIDYKKCIICGGYYTETNKSAHNETMEHIKYNQCLLSSSMKNDELYKEIVNRFKADEQRTLRVLYGDW